jgi:hypothetical protein
MSCDGTRKRAVSGFERVEGVKALFAVDIEHPEGNSCQESNVGVWILGKERSDFRFRERGGPIGFKRMFAWSRAACLLGA